MTEKIQRHWKLRDKTINLDKPIVMGIVNVTPDSFSDGGKWNTPDAALRHAMQLVEDGADILDVGGMSTRPGAADVSPEEEIKRVVPVIEKIAATCDTPISVDTFRSEVAKATLLAGASIVNDVLPFAGDEAMAEAVRTFAAGLVVMHGKGNPRTMDSLATYDNVVDEVASSLQSSFDFAVSSGISPEAIVADPGFGFAKNVAQNVELMRHIAEFTSIAPVLVGVSRKRFIGELSGEPDASMRDAASATAALFAYVNGASILRVHDARTTVQALKTWNALCLKVSS